MTQSVTVTVPTDSTKNVQIKVDGVKGKSCTELTAGLEAAFGGVDQEKRELTDEYKETPVRTTEVQQVQEGQF
jgi:hypothetical protein